MKKMSESEFAEGFKEWNDKLQNTGEGLKMFEIPLEGKVTVIAFDMLDAMKGLETKLSVVPTHQYNLKPLLGQVKITNLSNEEE